MKQTLLLIFLCLTVSLAISNGSNHSKEDLINTVLNHSCMKCFTVSSFFHLIRNFCLTLLLFSTASIKHWIVWENQLVKGLICWKNISVLTGKFKAHNHGNSALTLNRSQLFVLLIKRKCVLIIFVVVSAVLFCFIDSSFFSPAYNCEALIRSTSEIAYKSRLPSHFTLLFVSA